MGLAGTGCHPAPLDEVGKLCSEEHPCGGGFYCVSGVCTTDPKSAPSTPGCQTSGAGCPVSPVNLLSNGGFELGSPPSGWVALLGSFATERTVVRTGHQSGRLSATPPEAPRNGLGDATVMAEQVAADPKVGERYCADAWVRAPDSGAGLVELILGWGASGGQGVGSAVPGAAWTRVQASFLSKSGDAPSVMLRLTGSSVYIDDVRLWRSTSDSCQLEGNP